MTDDSQSGRWTTDGKFFRAGSRRVWMKAVTYGPFPGGWPESFDADFTRMKGAGFNAVRLFEMPETRLLDDAARHGLKVFAGLKWGQNADFRMRSGLRVAAEMQLSSALAQIGKHPALAGVYIANEIPADLVRWMGPVKVRKYLEELIAQGREVAPWLMFAYANYPSTEYLEPENADFTAMNIYLEDEEAFRSYLKRLHHAAGDRPLVVSEFGLDSRRNGLQKQADTLGWALQAAADLEAAGMTLYAWSDRWWNNGEAVMDWDFGLVDRENAPKPALEAISRLPVARPVSETLFSVIVCTRNGRDRIGNCLGAIANMTGGGFETLVVDDGSVDGTADYVAEQFPWVRLLRLEPAGLSSARNAGAEVARGDILAFTDDDCEPDREWISRMRPLFEEGKFAAACGPNLPPKPANWQEAVVCSVRGAPSHVMLDDEEAEHLPGCNLVVRKSAFMEIGGFDRQFQTAGDDVDFCWRLRDAEFRMGFVPGAFVWHRRRGTIWKFLKQQIGYGQAERLLMAKHPTRFSRAGHAQWHGFIYGGGPVRVMDNSIIYHGPMGSAGYQNIINRMLPLRGLDADFDHPWTRGARQLVGYLQPRLRAWVRTRRFYKKSQPNPQPPEEHTVEFRLHRPDGRGREDFLEVLVAHRWIPSATTAFWDLEKRGTKVLLATEHSETRAKTVLVRVCGKPSMLPFKLQ